MNDRTLTPLERESLTLLLSPENCDDPKLREQVDVAAVASREHTGVGLFVNLAVPDSVVGEVRENRRFSNLSGEMPGLESGFGGVLFIENGKLKLLEIFTYDETWPEKPEGYTLSLDKT